jgi:hypothetical protein
MNNVIKISEFKNTSKNDSRNENIDLSFEQVKKLENLRDGIEKLLNTATAVHGEPLGVSLAAGRYAAMKLYQMHGRAETMAFFNSCIETVEIAEDISVK